MPTLKEKVFSRITEDFQVLAKIVIRQLNLTKQLMDDNHKEEIYTEINNNERIIDSIEVKIRNEVINMIVLYSPRATNLRMIIHESEDDHLLLRYDRLSRTDRRPDSECFPFHEKNSSRRLSVHNL